MLSFGFNKIPTACTFNFQRKRPGSTRTSCGFFKATARIDFEVGLLHPSHRRTRMRGLCSIVLGSLFACGVAQSQQATTPGTTFALKDGDHVVFYGDSITEQRLYTSDIEEFMLTRFPGSRVTF